MGQGKNYEKHWRSIFRRVLTHYDEIRSVSGTNSCSAFYNGLQQEGGKSGFNQRIVRVIPADFLADVELAARRALPEAEYVFFKLVYLQKDKAFEDEARETLSEKRFADLKNGIQEKVGKMLEERKIYPIETYMKARDLR